MYKKNSIEESIQIVEEWKASPLRLAEFAALKDLTKDQMRYQIRKVRKYSQDNPGQTAERKIEFVPVPQKHLNHSDRMYDAGEATDSPSLMFQSGVGCLQVTNQIDPYLLKVAMEVMLSC